MEKSKKALMGMLVAMILSMGAMGSISQSHEDMATAQVSLGCGYLAGSTEGGWSGFWDSASNMTACAAGGMAAYGIGTAYVSTTNPIGWTYWAVTGVIGL